MKKSYEETNINAIGQAIVNLTGAQGYTVAQMASAITDNLTRKVIPSPASPSDILIDNLTFSGTEILNNTEYAILDTPIVGDRHDKFVIEYDITLDVTWENGTNRYVGFGSGLATNNVTTLEKIPNGLAYNGTTTETVTRHYQLYIELMTSACTIDSLIKFNLAFASIGNWSLTNGRVYKVTT